MIVCVCGGRDFRDVDALFEELDQFHDETPITLLVHGAQEQMDHELGIIIGADYLASWWAKLRGVKQKRYPANWLKFGPSAGPRRNAEMADNHDLDACIAFPRANGEWGNGTLNMIGNAQRTGVTHTRKENKTCRILYRSSS